MLRETATRGQSEKLIKLVNTDERASFRLATPRSVAIVDEFKIPLISQELVKGGAVYSRCVDEAKNFLSRLDYIFINFRYHRRHLNKSN